MFYPSAKVADTVFVLIYLPLNRFKYLWVLWLWLQLTRLFNAVYGIDDFPESCPILPVSKA
jgi:hypothetical protein